MKLNDWLEKSGLTQTVLAERVGVTQGRISQILKGTPPSFDLAARLQRITAGEVRFEDLIGAENEAGENGDEKPMTELDTVEAAISAIRDGEMVVVVDDDDRENEGDLIAAASRITPEQMAFMIRHTSGIVCAPMTLADARRLKLDPMVAMNDAPLGTAFTVSVDYKEGLTTGISAHERCQCVHALANANIQADDFVRPGHVFPLIAREGGVLIRSGHTEAAVDLARLADEPPVGVISELVNDDGTVKRGEDVLTFAREHGFKIISVADLIAHRQSRERLVEQTARFDVSTPVGQAKAFSYTTPFDPVEHLALVFGEIAEGENIPVRLHRADVLQDVFGNRATLNAVYDLFEQSGRGVLIYLREGTAGVPATHLSHLDAEENTASAQTRAEAWRDVGLGAQILRDLGVKSIELLSSSNRHYVGLSGFGIDIASTKALEG